MNHLISAVLIITFISCNLERVESLTTFGKSQPNNQNQPVPTPTGNFNLFTFELKKKNFYP